MPPKKTNKSAPVKKALKPSVKAAPKKVPAKKSVTKVKKAVLKKPVPQKQAAKKRTPSLPSPGLDLARKLRSLIEDKKGEDPVIINVEGLTSFTDYFLICSGMSDPQIRAIAEELEFQMKHTSSPCIVRDGTVESKWIILNFGDVYVHIFHPDARRYYALEELWKDGHIEE
ncbi:MAG: ribosome silencing factor [Verrucomicrobiota bacterium]|nr:ribosome silencing factor [Verrucomicrobiota bacterium]